MGKTGLKFLFNTSFINFYGFKCVNRCLKVYGLGLGFGFRVGVRVSVGVRVGVFPIFTINYLVFGKNWENSQFFPITQENKEKQKNYKL